MNTKEKGYDISRAAIPKAIWGDIEFEASTRQLLNDIKDMGDEREIPLLKALLENEKYSLFKERIIELIDKFNHNVANERHDGMTKPFSVFEDLFRTCDTEAKLILMEEIVAVGDEKDLHFLKELGNDASPIIRKKGSEVLKILNKKLGIQEMRVETKPAMPYNVDMKNDDQAHKTNQYGSFIGQIASFSKKIRKKLGGRANW